MKKIYQTPSFDVVYYNAVSVISTSGEPRQSSNSSDGGQMWGKRRPDIWGDDDE